MSGIQGLGRKVAKGAAWMVGFRLVTRSIGLVSTVILARLLVPADFGLVAMATSVIAVVELLQDFSFDVALIQSQDADRRLYDTAWTMNVLFGALCSVLLVLVSVPMAHFWGDSRVGEILRWLAVATFVGGFENIGVVAFRKELQFHREFWFQVVRKLIGFSITVCAAFALRSYWALVIGMVCGRIVGVPYTYLAHPYRPRFSLAARGALFRFSKWLFLNNIIFVANNRATDFFLGKLGGATALGIFSLSNDIASLPTNELSAPINRAIFPSYAFLSGDRDALRRHFLQVFSLVALVGIAAGVGIGAVSESLVATLLGPKWAACAALLPILSLQGVIASLQTSTGYVLMAVGKPRLVTVWAAALCLALGILLMLLVPQYGAQGAAWAGLIAFALVFPVSMYWLVRDIGIRWRDILQAVWRPVTGACCMLITVGYWQGWLMSGPIGVASALTLASSVGIGATTYSVVILFLWNAAGRPEGPEQALLQLARAKLPKKSKAESFVP